MADRSMHITSKGVQRLRESADISVKSQACHWYNVYVTLQFKALCTTVYSIAHNYWDITMLQVRYYNVMVKCYYIHIYHASISSCRKRWWSSCRKRWWPKMWVMMLHRLLCVGRLEFSSHPCWLTVHTEAKTFSMCIYSV